MENKNILKKIGLLIILAIIIIAIVFVVINSSSGKKEDKTYSNTATIEKVAQSEEGERSDISSEKTETKKVKVTKLENGTKYSITNKEIKPDIVIGDNYYGTQIADINLNFAGYEGKIIEIEGLYFENTPYTFVGRYSTSSVCPTCPPGYSYFEYQWHGDEVPELTDSESWIKVIGTLEKGYDGVEYYYINPQIIEVMNEKGLDTVSN